MTQATTDSVPLADLDQCLKKEYDILIAGFGILGSVLAFSLAETGRRILVIERDVLPPNRIVGELLQPGGVAALQGLGLADVFDDPNMEAQKCFGYQIFCKDTCLPCLYPKDALGRSFHHGRLVHGLRMRASSLENVDVVHGTAKKLVRDDSGIVVGVRIMPNNESHPQQEGVLDSVVLSASLSVIADGCFSNFRKELISRRPVAKSSFVGLILKDTDLPAPGHGHVFLPIHNKFTEEKRSTLDPNINPERGPILVYQLCRRETRMLIDVPGKQPNGKALQEYFEKVVAPSLPSRLLPSFWDAITSTDPDRRPRSMPNSFLTASPYFRETMAKGALILGDALNMRHPLTGGGMTVAINDCAILKELLGGDASLYVDLKSHDQVLSALEQWWIKRKNVSATVNTLAQALYSLFSGSDENLACLRDGCIEYVGLGGEANAGPVGLLSVTRPSTLLLFYHFFAVAFYSIYLLFRNASSVTQIPSLVIKSFSVFLTACLTIGPVLWMELTA